VKTNRMPAYALHASATNKVNAAQKPVLDELLRNGFVVTKVLWDRERTAVALSAKGGANGWLTPDGTFHRPIKGKTKVYINPTTMERVWK